MSQAPPRKLKRKILPQFQKPAEPDITNEPWYIADGWYNNTAEKNNLKIGILNNRITSQYDGFSLLDKRVKNF